MITGMCPKCGAIVTVKRERYCDEHPEYQLPCGCLVGVKCEESEIPF